MFNIGTQELLVILLLVFILFGPRHIPEVAHALGKGLGDLRRALSGVEEGMRRASGDFPLLPPDKDEAMSERRRSLRELPPHMIAPHGPREEWSPIEPGVPPEQGGLPEPPSAAGTPRGYGSGGSGSGASESGRSGAEGSGAGGSGSGGAGGAVPPPGERSGSSTKPEGPGGADGA